MPRVSFIPRWLLVLLLLVAIAAGIIFTSINIVRNAADGNSAGCKRKAESSAGDGTSSSPRHSGRKLSSRSSREQELLDRLASLPPLSSAGDDGLRLLTRSMLDRSKFQGELATLYAASDPDAGFSWILSIEDPDIRISVVIAFARKLGELRPDEWPGMVERVREGDERAASYRAL